MTHRIVPLILAAALATPAWSQQDPVPAPRIPAPPISVQSPPGQPDAEQPGAIMRGMGAIMDRLLAQDEAMPDPDAGGPGASNPDAGDPDAPDAGTALPDAEGLAQGLTGALRQMGPVLRDLAVQVDDFRHYETPERLPNGDILIRRGPDAPPPPPLGQTLDPEAPSTGPTGPGIAL